MATSYGRKKTLSNQDPKIVLEKEASDPVRRIENFIVLLYGPPKIGKTTWASNLKGAYFCATEPGMKFLKVRKTMVRDWPSFRGFVKAMKSDNTVDVVVVDTIDNLYKFCFEYVCEQKGMEHPSDLTYGKGWEAVSREWHKWITELAMLGKGLPFIGHATEREVEERSVKVNKIVPMIPKTGFASINALSDFIFYATYHRYKEGGKRKEKRILQTRATSNVEAGSRIVLPEIVDFDPLDPSNVRVLVENSNPQDKPVKPSVKKRIKR